jgi:hypothetical protein
MKDAMICMAVAAVGVLATLLVGGAPAILMTV